MRIVGIWVLPGLMSVFALVEIVGAALVTDMIRSIPPSLGSPVSEFEALLLFPIVIGALDRAFSMLFVPIALMASTLFMFAAIAATALLFLPWLYRSHARMRENGLAVNWTPSQSLACWFIPIVNLIRPYRVLADFCRSVFGDGGGNGVNWVLAWWLSSWGVVVAGFVALTGILGLKQSDIHNGEYGSVVLAFSIAVVAFVCCMVSGAVMTRRLEKGLQEKVANGNTPDAAAP